MADQVEYSNRLVSAIENSLSKAFNRDVRLTRQPSKRASGFKIALENGSKAATDDGGIEHPTLQVLAASKTPTTFYFGFSAVFGQETEIVSLRHASLIVFCDICGGELVSVFRAEWDAIAAANTNSSHAQPHWHFAQRPERIARILNTLSDTPQEFGGDDESGAFAGRAHYEDMHFAMSQMWNKDRAMPHKEMFGTNEFMEWFERVATYVSEQLMYVAEKVPSGQEREFGTIPPANELQ